MLVYDVSIQATFFWAQYHTIDGLWCCCVEEKCFHLKVKCFASSSHLFLIPVLNWRGLKLWSENVSRFVCTLQRIRFFLLNMSLTAVLEYICICSYLVGNLAIKALSICFYKSKVQEWDGRWQGTGQLGNEKKRWPKTSYLLLWEDLWFLWIIHYNYFSLLYT